MPKGFPIGFEMAEKNVNKQTIKQTDRHFRIYISRDRDIQIMNDMPKFRRSRLNCVARIAKTYVHTYKHSAKLRYMYTDFFSVIVKEIYKTVLKS